MTLSLGRYASNVVTFLYNIGNLFRNHSEEFGIYLKDERILTFAPAHENNAFSEFSRKFNKLYQPKLFGNNANEVKARLDILYQPKTNRAINEPESDPLDNLKLHFQAKEAQLEEAAKDKHSFIRAAFIGAIDIGCWLLAKGSIRAFALSIVLATSAAIYSTLQSKTFNEGLKTGVVGAFCILFGKFSRGKLLFPLGFCASTILGSWHAYDIFSVIKQQLDITPKFAEQRASAISAATEVHRQASDAVERASGLEDLVAVFSAHFEAPVKRAIELRKDGSLSNHVEMLRAASKQASEPVR